MFNSPQLKKNFIEYERRFEKEYGYFRPVVKEVVSMLSLLIPPLYRLCFALP